MADEPFLQVRSSSSDHLSHSTLSGHAHDWHHLVYVASGLSVVSTERGTWIAPPRWAAWVPAGVQHAIRFVGESALRTLYFRPDLTALPDSCCSLAVSPLLRELLLRTVELGMLDAREPAEAAMTTLLVAELGRRGPPPLSLPQPTSGGMQEVARFLAAESATPRGIARLARSIGVGTRTLERHFRAETGLTPGRWQQHYRLLKGLEVFAGGAMVKAAAYEAGFTTPSAYIAAFRKVFGTTPVRYFDPR